MGRAAGRKPSDPPGGREAGARTAVPTLHTGAEAGRDGLVNSEDPPTESQRQRAGRQGRGEASPASCGRRPGQPLLAWLRVPAP